MKDNCFFDTNILVYDFLEQISDTEIKKQFIVDDLIKRLAESESKVFISNQVLGEFINVFIKKYNIPEAKLKEHVLQILKSFEFMTLEAEDYDYALSISFRNKVGFYDSLIIAKALNSNCTILYSEDLSHNQIFEKKLKVINPFIQ